MTSDKHRGYLLDSLCSVMGLAPCFIVGIYFHSQFSRMIIIILHDSVNNHLIFGLSSVWGMTYFAQKAYQLTGTMHLLLLVA